MTAFLLLVITPFSVWTVLKVQKHDVFFLSQSPDVRISSTPALLWFFNRNFSWPEDVGRRYRCCKFCSKLFQSFGWIGLVYCQQTLAGFSLYYLLMLIASPVYAILQYTFFLCYLAVIVAVASVSIHFCAYRCKAERKEWYSLISFLLLSTASIAPIVVVGSISKDNMQVSFDSGHIVSALFTTAILSCLVFLLRQVVKHASRRSNSPEDADAELLAA